MKAYTYSEYGPPEVLSLKKIDTPVPKDHEILISLKATTVNRTDCGFRDPEYLIVYLVSGLFRPKNKILGNELSGVVEAIGKDVSLFKPGDEVFGLSASSFGTHAEYICLPENGSIALKPENMSHEEATAVCDGLMLANSYIKRIDFSSRPKILINGASGSIGSAALQLAAHLGAEVTAVCATKNIELMKELGAQQVIDYTKEDFTEIKDSYDVILDSVGKSTFFGCRKILKPKGIYYSSELGAWSQNIFLSLLTPLFGRKRVAFPIPKDSKEDIEYFKGLIEAGAYKAIIDRSYLFSELIDAMNYVETGLKTGNVVIKIG